MSDPEVVYTSGELSGHLGPYRATGGRIGLVPTMGALHAGHLTLIKAAAAENDLTVTTIFVNPAQFAPGEDFERYPRDVNRDRTLAGEAGADLVFQPAVDEIYPNGYRTYIEVEGLSDRLCGTSRPGHFRGVATVVWKLLQMANPTAAYFGAKDAQQLVLIRRMVRDLGGPWEIVACPTVREKDGLALSSRNNYLSAGERQRATALYRALSGASHAVESGERSRSAVVDTARRIIEEAGGIEVEYVECVSMDELEPADPLGGDTILAVAAKVGATRLIDNICLRINDNTEEILP